MLDSSANNSIDWGEFSTFILLGGEQKSKENQEGYENKEFSSQCYSLQTDMIHLHKEMISKIIPVTPSFYYTAAKDNTVRMWDSNSLEFRGILHTSHSLITDILYISSLNQLFISSVDRRFVVMSLFFFNIM